MSKFTGVKVFSATMLADRARLGETVTAWLVDRHRDPGFELVDLVVTQSSDSAFHLISITAFYREAGRTAIDSAVRRPTPGAKRLRFDADSDDLDPSQRFADAETAKNDWLARKDDDR